MKSFSLATLLIALGVHQIADAAPGDEVFDSSSTVSINTPLPVTGNLYIGLSTPSNIVDTSASGNITCNNDAVIGADTGSDSYALDLGTGTNFSNANGAIYIGRSGNLNTLNVPAGASINSKNVRVGGGSGATSGSTASGNGIYISGGIWTITGSTRVGSSVFPGTTNDTSNFLNISNGGQVPAKDVFVGYSSRSSSNSIMVSGSGSSLTTYDLIIGGYITDSPNNTVTIGSGGTITTISASGSTGLVGVRGSNTLEIQQGGILNATSLASNGLVTIEGGASANVSDSYAQYGSGVLRTKVFNPTSYGVLNVSNNVTIQPGATIDVDFDNCSSINFNINLIGVINSINPISASTTPTAISNCPNLTVLAYLSPDNRKINISIKTNNIPPMSIPTISEWGQIFMMISMLMIAGCYRRKMMR